MSFDINSYLSELRSSNVLYVPNPGNGGDTVIATATYQRFARLGVPYGIARPNKREAANRCLVYAGGGNLVNPNTFSARYLSSVHSVAKRLILLPHTIKNCDSLLAEFGTNVDLICRELPSYEYAKAMAPRANVFIADDMAFGLDVSEVASPLEELKAPSLAKYLTKRMLSRNCCQSFSNFQRCKVFEESIRRSCDIIDNGELNCFRHDGESIGKPLPSNNIDLSEIFEYGTESREIALLATQAIFRVLGQCTSIHTDRLHIAISGALLGINVNFHPNNYYKCAAIYEYSVKNRFKNVVWHG